MSYDFSSLSPADFEDLTRELIGKVMGIRFEGFGAGPDGGADGRHAVGGKTTILQAKHFVGSRFSSLKTAMKRERVSINNLAPKRYVLESVRKHYLGLQSFLSIRRIEARRKNASAFRLRHSQSLAKRRQRLSQAMVRSTIQRFGKTTNPLT